LNRAVRASDGTIVDIEARPFRLRIDGDPSNSTGLVLRGGVAVTIRGAGSMRRRSARFVLPTQTLLRTGRGSVELIADPRVQATVELLKPVEDPLIAAAIVDLVAELPPRILAGRPLITVAHAPPGEPILETDDMALRLIWPAAAAPLSRHATLQAAPSIGTTAAVSMDAREGVATASSRRVTISGRELTATVLDAASHRGRVWTTVRLEEAGRCSWVDVTVPVLAKIDPKLGRADLRGAGTGRVVRSGGDLGRNLPTLDALTRAAVAGSAGLMDALNAFRVGGPSGAATRAVLARTTGGALVKEINLAGLGGGTITPTDPAPGPRPRGR
jgi:hypothetical protein